MRSSTTSAARSIRFCRNGFVTITLIAVAGPASCGSSCVPPHAGKRPRKTSGNATCLTAVEIVRAEQCSASSSPPPRQAPLTAATVGNGSERTRAEQRVPRAAAFSRALAR